MLALGIVSGANLQDVDLLHGRLVYRHCVGIENRDGHVLGACVENNYAVVVLNLWGDFDYSIFHLYSDAANCVTLSLGGHKFNRVRDFYALDVQ